MLFNSLDYAVFLPLVFIAYWLIPKEQFQLQNILLLIASYVFYGWWDWRFLFLIAFSTSLDYYTGLRMYDARNQKSKKSWLLLSIIINLGFLGVFKYFNFFISSFADGLALLGLQSSYSTLKIILPVGISFYTFHGLSYVLDIYYNRIKPERNIISYSVFVSFFPLLVAGPIERATHLLPQIIKEREFDYSRAVDGLRQILWGLFKKIVIADNCAVYANDIFNNYAGYSGSTLLLGTFFFAIQIYCDFSGYSDIAIGTARLFGIELLRNFAFPYFARDIAEFWRRWHISLTTWFRDYLYIPLGGSKGGLWMKVRNIFIIFLVSGFWHGANWTFIAWGFLNAVYFLPLMLLNKNRTNTNIVAENRLLPNIREIFQMLTTFLLVLIAWIFFRADNLNMAFDYLGGIMNLSLFEIPAVNPVKILFPIAILFFMEWINRHEAHGLYFKNLPSLVIPRWATYMILILLIVVYSGEPQTFIYFQF